MKRRRIVNDTITPREKQLLSIEKAISIAVITVSGMLKNGNLTEKNYKDNLYKRLKAIQRKYGFYMLKETLPRVIKRMELNPVTTLNFNNQNTRVKLRFEYLKEYLESLGGE